MLKQGRKGQKPAPALLPPRHTHPSSSNQTRSRLCFLNLSHPLLLTSRSRRAGPCQAEPSRLEAEEPGLLQQKDVHLTPPPRHLPKIPVPGRPAFTAVRPRRGSWPPLSPGSRSGSRAESPRVCAAPEEVVTTTWREQEPGM